MAVVAELIAFGVAAEIVVIIEHEDARGAACVFEKEVSRAEAAHTGADDDEIVGFVGMRDGGKVDGTGIAQVVGDLERAIVRARMPVRAAGK